MFKNDGGEYLLNKYGCDVVTRIGAVYTLTMLSNQHELLRTAKQNDISSAVALSFP